LAAVNSNARARLLLGIAYYYGVEVDRNPALAVEWLIQAAVSLPKNMRAPRLIVTALPEPELLAQSKALIEYLLNFSNSHALFLFAQLYESGRLVERDQTRARRLYGSAATLGHRQAGQRVEKLNQPPGPLRKVLSWIKAR
jgi:TPR repeat protein